MILGIAPLDQPLVNPREHQVFHHGRAFQHGHAPKLCVQLRHVFVAHGSKLSEEGVPAAEPEQRHGRSTARSHVAGGYARVGHARDAPCEVHVLQHCVGSLQGRGLARAGGSQQEHGLVQLRDGFAA